MSEVYDIHTGKRLFSIQTVFSERERKRIARQNDQIRRKFRPLEDIIPSNGIMCLEKETLYKIVRTLRKSRYEDINYSHICDRWMSQKQRLDAEKLHAGGLFGVGSPTLSVVWNIRNGVKKIELSLAEEVFYIS